MIKTRLNEFNPSVGFARGRSSSYLAIWWLVKSLFFLTSIPWPSSLKRKILIFFGAKVGIGVVIKPRVNIHFPWKLSIGDYVWLGDQVDIINFQYVEIGSHACISQQVMLCAASHDFRDPTFSYRNSPITIGCGVWLQARVFVCPGISIGDEAVVTVCSTVMRDMPSNCICSGNPAVVKSIRWK